MSPPKIRIRGARASIPAGSLIGRVQGGRVGELQVLRPQDLARMGLGANASQQRAANLSGFTFFEEGLMLAGELLGQGAWAHDVQFSTGAAGDAVHSEVAATADAALTVWAPDLSNIYVQVATITFAAGTTTGVIAWTPGPFLLLGGKILKLYGPAVADLTLAGVTGVVVGAKP